MASLPAHFVGTWELDKAKSESSEEMLTAQGVGWAKRKIINNSGVTMHIKEEGGKIHIKQETTFTTNDNVWELGVEKDIENPIVGKGKGTLTVEGDKLKLIMDGENGRTTVMRSVEGNEMINETSYKELKMIRYFAKK